MAERFVIAGKLSEHIEYLAEEMVKATTGEEARVYVCTAMLLGKELAKSPELLAELLEYAKGRLEKARREAEREHE